MNGVRHAFMLVVGLALGSTTACDHGRCVLSGMPTCSSMNAAGCQRTPHCRWDKICQVKTSCGDASEATCKTLDYCRFGPTYCESISDPCELLSVEDCASDERCGVIPGCIGTPVSCDTYDDSDSCEADIHCDWSPSPAF